MQDIGTQIDTATKRTLLLWKRISNSSICVVGDLVPADSSSPEAGTQLIRLVIADLAIQFLFPRRTEVRPADVELLGHARCLGRHSINRCLEILDQNPLSNSKNTYQKKTLLVLLQHACLFSQNNSVQKRQKNDGQ